MCKATQMAKDVKTGDWAGGWKSKEALEEGEKENTPLYIPPQV